MRTVLGLPLLCFSLSLWGQAQISQENDYWVQTSEASVSSAGVEVLVVKSWGDVFFEGTNAERIDYSLKTKVRAYSRDEAARLMVGVRSHAKREANGLYLQFDCEEPDRVMPVLRVTAPRRLVKSYLKTRAGLISASNLEGKLVAESGGGRITADRIEGGVHAETIGGEIRLGRVNGSVRCVSGAGNIYVEYVGGEEAWLDTVGGEIYVAETAGNVHLSNGGGNIFVRKAGGSVVAHTAEGLIEVVQAAGHVYADTASGSIKIHSARGAKCESGGGAIKVKEVSGPIHVSTASGNIIVAIPHDAVFENSFLDTGLGDIAVYLPSNLAVTVKARNTRGGAEGRIVSEFEEIKVQPNDRVPYEAVTAHGDLHGGGPVLKVSAAAGTIYFKRR